MATSSFHAQKIRGLFLDMVKPESLVDREASVDVTGVKYSYLWTGVGRWCPSKELNVCL